MAARVTEAVKCRAGNKPVMVKLSPNVTDVTVIARAVENAGARWSAEGLHTSGIPRPHLIPCLIK